MKLHTKKRLSFALRWSLFVSLLFLVVPVVIGITSGAGISGRLMGEKLVGTIGSFPFLFLICWWLFSEPAPKEENSAATGSNVEK